MNEVHQGTVGDLFHMQIQKNNQIETEKSLGAWFVVLMGSLVLLVVFMFIGFHQYQKSEEVPKIIAPQKELVFSVRTQEELEQAVRSLGKSGHPVSLVDIQQILGDIVVTNAAKTGYTVMPGKWVTVDGISEGGVK